MEPLLCRTLSASWLPPPTLFIPGSRNTWHRWQSTASVACTPALASLSSSDVWTGMTHCSSASRGQLWRREARCRAAFGEFEEAKSAVLVVGGGILGLEAVRALVDADILVAAYQRDEKFDIPEAFHDEIEEMGWDVIDVATIEKVLGSAPFDAIVCTVGGRVTRSDLDKDVPIKLVNAAKMAGVARFILVSSTGVKDSPKALDEKTVEDVAEEAVKASSLNYTIIRPGELLSTPATGNGILTETPGIAGLISRADVAALIMEVLFNEKSYGKTLTAVDQDKFLPPASRDGVKVMSL